MQPLTIHIDRPIETAAVIGNQTDDGLTAAEHPGDSGQLEINQQKARLAQLCSALKKIIETLDKFQDSAFTRRKEDIVKLSLEIARKVLAQKVKESDYQIESIIHQALEGLTVQQDVIVRLNPTDHSRIEELLKSSEINDFRGLTFVSDGKIAPAECVLETNQGTIEALIEEKLQHIADALRKSQ